MGKAQKRTKKTAVEFLQEVSPALLDVEECYEFTWIGKKAAMVEANIPTKKILLPYEKESKDWENTSNLYIEGENLDALKLLQNDYENAIKVIYIDPPYNTGKEFIYRDIFSMKKSEYPASQVRDRNHSGWCSMIYARLWAAYHLLADDGVIFISIDDNEAHNLRKICDEIFGEENLVEIFYNQVRYANKSLTEKDFYQKLIEQTLLYKKKDFIPNRPYEEYSLDKFCYQIVEKTRGIETNIGGKKVSIFKAGEYEIKKIAPSVIGLKETWASGTVLKGNASGKFFDQHLSPRIQKDGLGVLYKVEGIGEDGLGYRYFTGPKRAKATKGKFYSGVPTVRAEEMKKGVSKRYKPILNFADWSANFGNVRHEGGVDFRAGKKPVDMLKFYIRMATDKKENHIVLDFFSGSSSTAHAVMQLNAEDGGNRRFIMVQLQEKIPASSDYRRAGFLTISELGKERIRRAGERIRAELEKHNGKQKPEETAKSMPDLGFRVLKVEHGSDD